MFIAKGTVGSWEDEEVYDAEQITPSVALKTVSRQLLNGLRQQA